MTSGRERAGQGLFLDFPTPVAEALERYAGLVRHFAPRLDLISPRDLDRFESRHVADSLRALGSITGAPPGPCVDVGSGAGLPGIPLAIARPDRVWRLLEPRRKRAGFLDEVVRELRLDRVEVVRLTAEQAATDPGLARGHAVAAARALAPPARAFDLIMPLVAPGGVGVVFVGSASELPRGAEERDEGLATMIGSASTRANELGDSPI